MQKFKSLIVLLLVISGVFLSSCGKDDEPSNDTKTSLAVGKWAREDQWAYTEGTRETSYTLRSGGTGTYKWWDWGEQKYYTTSLTWEAVGNVVMISRKSTKDTYFADVIGYISGSGANMKIDDDWYYKQ